MKSLFLVAAAAATLAFSVADEMKMPEVGQPAPKLRLNNHEGKLTEVPAGEDFDWTVLAFYPKAATPG